MPHQLTRRQLLKAVGIGTAAGVTLAAVGLRPGTPEAAESALAKEIPHRYWWVKTVDKPNVEIEWKAYSRFSEWRSVRGSIETYRGSEVHRKIMEGSRQFLLDSEKDSVPGYTSKDIAMKAAVSVGTPPFRFMGPQTVPTPAQRGVPRYEGTPEDNARILTVAMRHLGAGTIGFVELEPETTRKFVFQEEPAPGKKRIDFADAEVGHEEELRLVIPNKARWAIVFTVQMSTETMKYGPTMLGSQTTALTYMRMWNILAQTQEFLRGLGYQGYGPSQFNGLAVAPALAVFAGLGEMSRLNRMITPEYGPMARCTSLITDMPLAPTKPIRFGVADFCKSCMTCAEMCPGGALSFDKEPSWEVKGAWNNPGHRAYFEDSVKCRDYWDAVGTNCGTCFMVCPYAVDDDASLHRIVKGTAANTSFFNGLFVAGSHWSFPATSGEPMKDPESWWHNTNLAELGIDTRRGGRNI